MLLCWLLTKCTLEVCVPRDLLPLSGTPELCGIFVAGEEEGLGAALGNTWSHAVNVRVSELLAPPYSLSRPSMNAGYYGLLEYNLPARSCHQESPRAAVLL